MNKRYLKCFNGHPNFFTKDVFYKVVDEKIDEDGDNCYIIDDDNGEEHHITIEPDRYGLSYKAWFELVEKEE
jgi:hypothetical protein